MGRIDFDEDTVKKIQSIIYPILCDIDDLCKKNHLTYFLSGGSCLGAARHKGFIPWDDDADIMLPRKEYERFLELAHQAFEGKYKVGFLAADPDWKRANARVYDMNTRITYVDIIDVPMGISVDVFPIDGLPGSRLGRKLFFPALKILDVLRNSGMRLAYSKTESGIWLKKIITFFVKPIGARFFAGLMDKLASRFDFETSVLVACSIPAHYGSKETIKREYMTNAVFLPFEDRLFPVPSGYQTYLSNLYGDDYMEIPTDIQKKGASHLDHWTLEFKDKEQ